MLEICQMLTVGDSGMFEIGVRRWISDAGVGLFVNSAFVRLVSPAALSVVCSPKPSVASQTHLPARQTFTMKSETGKWEVRPNSQAVFFKPLFY